MSRVFHVIRPDQPCPYWGTVDDALIGPCESGNDGHAPPCRFTIPVERMTLGDHLLGFVLHDLEAMWRSVKETR